MLCPHPRHQHGAEEKLQPRLEGGRSTRPFSSSSGPRRAPHPVTLSCCSSGSSSSLPRPCSPALQKQMVLCWLSDPNQPRAAEQRAVSQRGCEREAEAAPRSSASLAAPCSSTNSPETATERPGPVLRPFLSQDPACWWQHGVQAAEDHPLLAALG